MLAQSLIRTGFTARAIASSSLSARFLCDVAGTQAAVGEAAKHAAVPISVSSASGTSPAAAGTTPAPAAFSRTSSSKHRLSSLSDDDLLRMLRSRELSIYSLEHELGDCTRAVQLRRRMLVEQLEAPALEQRVTQTARTAMDHLPYTAFNEESFYRSILGANCESVIGYVPLPVGVVGPVRIDGQDYMVPLATTEGALIASTNRGCRAITESGGASTCVIDDGMTRAPLVRMPSLAEAARLRAWINNHDNFQRLAEAFGSTTRFGRLSRLTASMAGRNVYLRFKCSTGDAMGMNMITKGVNAALIELSTEFPGMDVLALSGNFCTDKKPSAVNWIEGRGKSVVCEVRLSKNTVQKVLKTSVDAMISLNTSKNLVGSALAGSIGGFNAHASNIVSALFLATGQDAAQNIESSHCMTLMERDGDGLLVTVTMPSIEVGTVGGGTSLPAQSACLDLLGLRGANKTQPGQNAQKLARVVAGAVLAGELSLMAALTSGDLLNSHMRLNRKHNSEAAATPAAAAAAAAPHHHAPSHTPGTAAFHTAGPAITSSAASPGRRFFAAASRVQPQEQVEDVQPMLSVP